MLQHAYRMGDYPREWESVTEAQVVSHWRNNKQLIIDYREGKVDQLDIGGTAWAARFNGTGYSRASDVVNVNGYVVVDYDHLDDLEVAEALRDLTGKSPHTRIAAVSKSGKGVHIVVKVGKSLEIIKNSWYSVVAEVIRYYDDLTGFRADRQGSGLSRVLFDTWDSELIYHPSNTFPLPASRVYNGEERRLNAHAELNDSIWPRIFGAAYSLVKADIEQHGRIRHETLVLSLLPLVDTYAESMVEFLKEVRTGAENWGLDELETLAIAGAGPLGIGSIIHAARLVDNLHNEADTWLTDHGWDLKIQFSADQPWASLMPNYEAKLNRFYNHEPIPVLIQARPRGLRWTNRLEERAGLGDVYKMLNATSQYRRGLQENANPPLDLVRMCENWTYTDLPEIDRIATTARVVDGEFYGHDSYVPDRQLLVKPERQLKDSYRLDEALNIWEDYCGQFAFASKHSKRNLLLLHISPLLRAEAYGWTIQAVTKPNKSVGGTKAVQAGWYALHTSGFASPSIPMTRLLGARMIDTALADTSNTEVYFDNVYTLNYVTLKTIPVSAEVLIDPKMQRAYKISTRNLTIFADGINISLDNEMRRRTLVVQLTEEEAIRQRAIGYRHPVIIRDIQQNQDFTDALLSLAYHYTQSEKPMELPRYIDSLEEFTEVAYRFLRMCYGTDAADEWLEEQCSEAATPDIGDDEQTVIPALQLGWKDVFQEGERIVRARDLLYWIKNDAVEHVETFNMKHDGTAGIVAETNITDILKKGDATSLSEFTWQLKDTENRLFELEDGRLVKLVLSHQKSGANRGTWCQLQIVDLEVGDADNSSAVNSGNDTDLSA